MSCMAPAESLTDEGVCCGTVGSPSKRNRVVVLSCADLKTPASGIPYTTVTVVDREHLSECQSET